MSVSDEEILNATLAALNVFGRSELCKTNKNTQSDGNVHIKHELSEYANVPSSLSNKSSESIYGNSRSYEFDFISDICPKTCPEFKEAIEALAVIDQMYNFYHEKQLKKCDKEMHSLLENFSDAILPSNFKLNVEKMQTVLDHITAISSKGAKLKQVLRSSILDEFWRVNVDYHKSVVRFFTLAQEITKDVQDFIKSIEISKEHNQNRSKSLNILETKLLAELHENLDILNQFRNYVISSVN